MSKKATFIVHAGIIVLLFGLVLFANGVIGAAITSNSKGTCVIMPNSVGPDKVFLGKGTKEASNVCDARKEGCGKCLSECVESRKIIDKYGCDSCGADGFCNDATCDGGDPDCAPAVCGNGIVETGEQCDDNNALGGDGCSSTCQIEGCGNGIVEGTEQCDPPESATSCPAGTAGSGVCDSDCKIDSSSCCGLSGSSCFTKDDCCSQDCIANTCTF